MNALLQTAAAVRDLEETRRGIEEALKRSRVITQGLSDLTEALGCVTGLLIRLRPWVSAGLIDAADIALVAHSIEALRDRCRELEALAAVPAARRGHASSPIVATRHAR